MTRVRGRYERIPCLVPGCGCGATCYPPGNEIICVKHYRLVDKCLKRRRALFRRRGREDLADRMWVRIRRQAIERAMGIA